MFTLLRVRLAQTFIFIALLIQPLSVAAQTQPSPDFDGDGVVGISDFLLFVDHFGSRQDDGKYQAKYDLDGNGEIGIPDFLLFASDFGRTAEFFRSATTYQQFVKA